MLIHAIYIQTGLTAQPPQQNVAGKIPVVSSFLRGVHFSGILAGRLDNPLHAASLRVAQKGTVLSPFDVGRSICLRMRPRPADVEKQLD